MVSHEFKGYGLLLLFSVASVTSAYITEEFANLLQSHHALTKVGQNSATSSGISTTVVRNGDDLVQTGFSRLGVETGRESLENRSSNETNSDSAKTRALCQNQKLDVVFVLDGSRTMTLQKFQNMLSFVNQMSGRMHIGKDKTRVGVMQYSSCIRPHIFLNQHYDVKELQNAIMRIKYEGKGTAVGRALKFAARRMFSKRKGTRDLSSGVRRMLILITDGKWSRQDEVRDGIRELENLNVERFAIGMGRSMRSVELGLLSSKPTKTHVHYVHHLSELNKVGYKILDELCTDRSCVNANINNEGLSGFDLLKSLNMKQQSGVSTIKGSKKDLNAFEIGPQTALQIFPASLLFPNNLPQNFAITTVFRMNELTPNENWSILEFRRSSGGALVSLRVIGSEKPNQIHFLAEDKNKQQQIYKFKGVDTLFQSGFHKLTLFVTPTRATVTVDCTLIGHVTLTYPAILSNSDGPIVVARNIRSDDSVVVDIQELSIWCNATYEGNSDEHFNCCGLPGQCESKASNNIQQQNIERNSERQAETRFIPNKRREFNSNPAIVRPSGISSTRNENQNTANNVRVSRPHGIPGSSNRGVAPERSPPGHRRTTPHNRESQNRLTVPRPRQETVINVVPKPSTPPPTVQSLPTSDNCPKLPGPPGPRGFRGPKGHHGDTGEDGKIGYTGKPGLPGTPGANGPRGHQGDRGEPGPQGYRGHKGSRGIKGDMGPVGPKGQNGMTGPTGRPGMAGPRGRQGAPGEKGANGEKGTTGVEGDAGNPGATGKGGRPGKQGEKGSTGIVGLRGPRGHHGRPGIQGLPGRKGVAGPPGETGMPGLRGKPGSKGETGEPGTIGEEGPPGRPGNPGRKGDNGPSGDMGPRGDQGAPGEKGSSGLQGRPGRPGPSGFVGPKGHKGMEGPVGKKGNTGITGPQGLPGVKGEEGEAGPIGETGFKGDQGNRGPVGPMGLPGLKGEKGERGFEGPIGEAGISGRTGPRGPRGPPRSLKEIEALIVKALSEMMPAHLTAIRHQCQRCIPPSKLVQGKTGPPGENGRKGEKGREGPKGNTGPTGHIGLQGPRGERGLSGPMGDKGDMGERGHSIVGPMGPPGKPGQKGKAGKSYRGKDGTPGKQGIVGPRGNPGKPGAKGHEGVCDASNCGTQAAYVNPPHGFYPRDTKGPSPAQRPDDHGRPGHRGSPAQIPGEQVRLNISPRVLQQLKGPNRQHVYNLDDGLNQQTRQRNLN